MQNTVRAAGLAVERENRDSWGLEPLNIEPKSPVPRSESSPEFRVHRRLPVKEYVLFNPQHA